MQRLLPLFVCALMLFGGLAVCQSQDDRLTIRVESNRVLVPVTAIHYRCRQIRLQDGTYTGAGSCFPGGNVDYDPCDKTLIPAKDFRLSEDGAEQKIDGVEVPKSEEGIRRDNLGTQLELSANPKGILSALVQSFEWCSFYVIAYKPPTTPKGSCHKIHVKVSGDFLDVKYADQYCNVDHTGSDVVSGTAADNKLEQCIASKQPGGIHPGAEANYFYTAAGPARVYVDIEFPFQEMRPKNSTDVSEPFNLLILAYDKNGNVVARHSVGAWQYSEKDPAVDYSVAPTTPSRYDAELDLPAGEYKIATAVSFGDKFGITEVPLTIDDYDGKQVGISSIALCKRFRQAGQPPVAKEFVLLISQNYEFTPAADHAFHPGDTVMAYFELYRPAGAHRGLSPIRFDMKITNTTTGHVDLDTGEMSADQWMKAHESTIPVSLKLVLEKLVPGDYKLEIQAWDSAGKATPWRAANFSIQ